MKSKTIHYLLATAVIALGLALVPASSFAAEDDAGTDDEPAVTLDEMTTGDEDAAQPAKEKTFASNGDTSPNWAAIVGQNALWGGITGALVGTGLYLVTGLDWSPWIIAQFAGGGILVGATVGVISAATQTDPDTTQALEPPTSVDWVTRDLPRTYQLDFIQLEF